MSTSLDLQSNFYCEVLHSFRHLVRKLNVCTDYNYATKHRIKNILKKTCVKILSEVKRTNVMPHTQSDTYALAPLERKIITDNYNEDYSGLDEHITIIRRNQPYDLENNRFSSEKRLLVPTKNFQKFIQTVHRRILSLSTRPKVNYLIILPNHRALISFPTMRDLLKYRSRMETIVFGEGTVQDDEEDILIVVSKIKYSSHKEIKTSLEKLTKKTVEVLKLVSTTSGTCNALVKITGNDYIELQINSQKNINIKGVKCSYKLALKQSDCLDIRDSSHFNVANKNEGFTFSGNLLTPSDCPSTSTGGPTLPAIDFSTVLNSSTPKFQPSTGSLISSVDPVPLLDSRSNSSSGSLIPLVNPMTLFDGPSSSEDLMIPSVGPLTLFKKISVSESSSFHEESSDSSVLSIDSSVLSIDSSTLSSENSNSSFSSDDLMACASRYLVSMDSLNSLFKEIEDSIKEFKQNKIKTINEKQNDIQITLDDTERVENEIQIINNRDEEMEIMEKEEDDIKIIEKETIEKEEDEIQIINKNKNEKETIEKEEIEIIILENKDEEIESMDEDDEVQVLKIEKKQKTDMEIENSNEIQIIEQKQNKMKIIDNNNDEIQIIENHEMNTSEEKQKEIQMSDDESDKMDISDDEMTENSTIYDVENEL